MKITIVAAIARNGVIGTAGGQIPWRLPRDSAHFRSTVSGHHMLLGRKTYEEMIGWFKDEIPIVLSSKPVEGVESVSDPSTLTSICTDHLMICGGASIYNLLLPQATHMILTHVQTDAEGPAKFPNYDPADWIITKSQHHSADADNSHSIDIIWYKRKQLDPFGSNQ
jgi:dihydrofolate reductase